LFGNNCAAVVLKEFEPHAERPIEGLFFKSALVRVGLDEKYDEALTMQVSDCLEKRTRPPTIQ
jgi:hypothetical protein